MILIRILIFSSLFFCSQILATTPTIAVDGAAGYMGTSLIKDIETSNLRLGYHRAIDDTKNKPNVFIGKIYDSLYLENFLRDVEVYYQMAAISSVFPDNTIEEYILTNSLGPYLASRINVSMTMLSFSTIAVYDIQRDEKMDAWIKDFVFHFDSKYKSASTSAELLEGELYSFVSKNDLPELKPKQYYGFSKILLEALLRKSAEDRSGNIYIIRCGMIIGEDIRMRRGNSVVKNILQAMFEGKDEYEVWNRVNYYTPASKIKSLMLYTINNTENFKSFEIFDSGYIAMQQHEFVRRLMAKANSEYGSVKLVDTTLFKREAHMNKDDRILSYYPVLEDVDQSISDMLKHYVGS